MSHTRTIANLEADIAALRAAADRAGTSLACLFSSSDEFEAEVVRVRREQGAFDVRNRVRYPVMLLVALTAFVLVFL